MTLNSWHWLHNKQLCSREIHSFKSNIQVIPSSENGILVVAVSHFQYHYPMKWMSPERLISVTNLLVLPQNLIRYSLCSMFFFALALWTYAAFCASSIYWASAPNTVFPAKIRGRIICLLCQFLELLDSPICLWLWFWILFWTVLSISCSCN